MNLFIKHRASHVFRLGLAILLLSGAIASAQKGPEPKLSGRTVVAEIVALDQPFMLNRLGSSMPTGQIFALRTDIEPTDGASPPLPGFAQGENLSQYVGKVTLRSYKRPRPIVLRVNVGDVLEIRFSNLLQAPQLAGCHVMGLNLLPSPDDKPGPAGSPPLGSDGSFVGNNADRFAQPGQTRVYRYIAGAEGTFILYSAAQPNGTAETARGLFGCVTVQPPQAEYYRSQVTRTDLFYSTYRTDRLPANTLLHKKPGTADEWTLTTYKTRLRQEAIKNVDVVIEKVRDKLPNLEPAPSSQNAVDFYRRNVQTGDFEPVTQSEEQAHESVKHENAEALMEKGDLVPAGYLYSAEPESEGSGHPIIDYPIFYDGDHRDAGGRPDGWPILRMLYPAAKSLLTAQTDVPGSNITKGASSFQLQGDEGKYQEEITELDLGNIPRDLIPILSAWGVEVVPGLTVTSPERSYISQIPGTQPALNYIWLVNGVKVDGEENASVIIQGSKEQGKAELRFLRVELQLLYSDPTAIITGPQAGRFRYSEDSSSFYEVPATPDRRQPYREFALGYNFLPATQQAFREQQGPSPANPALQNSPLSGVLANGADGFAINYGSAGIATEILANRLGVGPEGINRDGVDLKFEEFFLSSWAAGDPAMMVDRPANTPDEAVTRDAQTNSWVKNGGGAAGTSPLANKKARATKVFYPDDPSNVYHSYMRDHVTFRIYNAGGGAIPHVHHLHAHQWLRSPNADDSAYLDSQLIIPGSAFSLDMVYNGSGNRNQTVGDSIFHCHFYPHFARGMWALWRVHDVFEEGTLLDRTGAVVPSDPGNPDLKLAWVRALPDAEISTGTPIPAIVPLPTLGMAPLPARVRVAKIPAPTDPIGRNADELRKWVNVEQSNGRLVQVRPEYLYERSQAGNVRKDRAGEPIEKKENGESVVLKDTTGSTVYNNPGYPFFIPGVAGHRPPHPPLAMAWQEQAPGVPALKDGEKIYLDGGLPRHQVLGGQIVREFHTRWDFTKDFIGYKDDDHLHETADNAVAGALVAYRLPEDGTPIEKAAMRAHSTRTHKTVLPDGNGGNFILNGLPPANGAPYADPGVDDNGNAARDLRKYKAAVIQKDVVLNKDGWHYPQERFLTLWQDVKPTFDEKRPPQPFFFRANGGETVEYWHTNLVPDYYEMDDFQVRTPTDIIGQHIHLVKFDVTSSDGAANGFNYEDGVFSPDEVRSRIFAITRPWVEGSHRDPKLQDWSARKYDLFAFNDGAGGVSTINWRAWAYPHRKLEPTPWDHSYLQKQMSQGLTDEKEFLTPPHDQNWDGAMTSIMRFSTDPFLNNQGKDRTVRTVFTHDHFSPSTHQQTGLYGGLLVEPPDSTWTDPVTGLPYYDTVNRSDGGPTGWEAIIRTANRAESYREFALALQDTQLAYRNNAGHPGLKDPSLPPATPLFNTTKIQSGTVSDGKPVSSVSVTDPFNPNQSTSLTAFFADNGITLSDGAVFHQAANGALGILDSKNYDYGPGVNAFNLSPTGATGYDVTAPHLKSWADGKNAVNPPAGPKTFTSPFPSLLSGAGTIGTYSFNYRNEPLINPFNDEPNNSGRVGKTPNGDPANDYAFAFASIKRPDPWNNVAPPASPVTGRVPPPLFNRPEDPAKVNGDWEDPVGFAQGSNGVNDGKVSSYDPYTPLLRGYQGDRVQLRALVGAHDDPHAFMVHGVKWLFEPTYANSGYRNSQELGISEHFELIFPLPPATAPHPGPDSQDTNAFTSADYFYGPAGETTGLQDGLWGMMRSYDPPQPAPDPLRPPIASLYRLPETANPRHYPGGNRSTTALKHPDLADVEFTIIAQTHLITYNDGNYGGAGPIQNQNGIVFTVDQVKVHGQVLPGAVTKPDDPLVLRVRAGDWVKVILNNKIPASYTAATATATTAGVSSTAGLHSQLLGYDVTQSDGANIGFNPVQTVNGTSSGGSAPGQIEYWWYAGDLERDRDGTVQCRPRELGAVNLVPPDALNQHRNGLVGALVVEPQDATWSDQDYVGAAVAIKDQKGDATRFREFVLVEQNDLNASFTNGGKRLLIGSGVNNKSEDLAYRVWGPGPTANPVSTPTLATLYSNQLTGGDPKTPVFEADAHDRVRFRVVFPGGPTPFAFEIHGHSWQEEPYVDDALKLGDNVKSEVTGARTLAPYQALNILIDSAGGPFGIAGDYLCYSYLQTTTPSATTPGSSGAWGILRVKEKSAVQAH